MNITEFAEQVVFGTTIEDKLLDPGRLTHDADVSSRPRVDTLSSPGRPVGMQMHGGGRSVQPPSDDQLENEKARGQLLHFLANHELLATELMALVLLKFPDAPHAFRQGVLVTLREEQEHTRMYLRRMKECGVEFGSFPLSGQFWRVVEPMQSPMDFVSRLSLTFEQANLDYSLHFASVFRRIGDDDTAEILQTIYEDEIGHVQHGLHWFRQWKNPDQSDWEAYQSSLDFPMSPQRARGPRASFNRDGRTRAGLTDDFIDAVEVYRQSRGRRPTVRWFDPAAEAALSRSLSGKQTRLMEQLGKDLELLMVPTSRQDDVLLLRRIPSREFRKELINAGFDVPEFIAFDERASLGERKLHELSPWAWTPSNLEFAKPLVGSAHHVPKPWQTANSDLFRKSWGAARLCEWLDQADRPESFVSPDVAGVAVHSIDELNAALRHFEALDFASALIKQDLASSGRGQRRANCSGQLNDEVQTWFESLVNANEKRKEAVAVVEPELDRLLDLSFLWRLDQDSEQADFLGWTRPLVTAGRRYVGTRLRRPFADCDEQLRRFVVEDRCAKLQAVAEWLEPRVTKELRERDFTGHFGVDALVCHDVKGELRIKPLVELNPRMTMGHVALNLAKRLAPEAEAELRILTRDEWQASRKKLESQSLKLSRDGRWESGAVWMGEVDEMTKLVPVVLVGKDSMAVLCKI